MMVTPTINSTNIEYLNKIATSRIYIITGLFKSEGKNPMVTRKTKL